MDLAALRRQLNHPRVRLAIAGAAVAIGGVGCTVATSGQGAQAPVEQSAPAALPRTDAAPTPKATSPATAREIEAEEQDQASATGGFTPWMSGTATPAAAKPTSPRPSNASPTASPAATDETTAPASTVRVTPVAATAPTASAPAVTAPSTGTASSPAPSGTAAAPSRAPAGGTASGGSNSGGQTNENEPCMVGGTEASSMPQCDTTPGSSSGGAGGGSESEAEDDLLGDLIATVEELLPVDTTTEVRDEAVDAVESNAPSEAAPVVEAVPTKTATAPAQPAPAAPSEDVAPVQEPAPTKAAPTATQQAKPAPAPMFEPEPEPAPAPAPAAAPTGNTGALPTVTAAPAPMF